MNERHMRVPLPSPPIFIQDDDVAASVCTTPRYARRFSLDIAEEALAKMGPAVVQHVAQQLGERVVWDHQQDIERVVFSYLTDRTWAEPIIRKAVEDSVRRFIFEIMISPPSTDTDT
jgi:hypothetical protein